MKKSLRKERDGNPIYAVRKSELLGRNINAGEKIIEEDALVIGPKNDSKIVCLGCYQKIDYTNLKQMQCKRCKWPICGDGCAGLGTRYGHLLDECTLLAKISIDAKSCHEIEQLYCLITPLRCLLLKINNLQMWHSLCTLEAHNQLRKTIDDIWNFNQVFIVNQIRSLFGLNQFTDTEIHTVCGILEVFIN